MKIRHSFSLCSTWNFYLFATLLSTKFYQQHVDVGGADTWYS